MSALCHKSWFPNQVELCKRSNYVKKPHVVEQHLTGKYVHVCDEGCTNGQCTVLYERSQEWICHTCHEHLKKGRMSPRAAVKLELAEIRSELSDLNILERHPIAKCIPFAKIIPLPKGRQQ